MFTSVVRNQAHYFERKGIDVLVRNFSQLNIVFERDLRIWNEINFFLKSSVLEKLETSYDSLTNISN